MGRCTFGPGLSGLGEGLAGRDVLVPSRTSDSCDGPGAMHAGMVARCTVFPPTHWCGWLPGKQALCQEAVWLGWVVFRRKHSSRALPLPSPYGRGELPIGYHEIGRKKFNNKKKLSFHLILWPWAHSLSSLEPGMPIAAFLNSNTILTESVHGQGFNWGVEFYVPFDGIEGPSWLVS